MQENTQVQTTPPLPGPTLVDQVNKALQTIATHFSGSNDPASIAWPYSIWADTGNGRLKMRNAAGTAWIDLCPLETPLMTRSDSDLQWLSKPIGEPFPLWTHIPGVQEPPTGSSEYRFIKLTASDSYNDGVLTDESVTGSAPLVQATAVIDLEASPLHGQTVRLINTERRVLRAGSSGTEQNDALQNITGQFTVRRAANSNSVVLSPSGAFSASSAGTSGTVLAFQAGEADNPTNISFNASNVARTDVETRMRNVGADYFMRIY
jgi:hypothetical protein